MEKAPIQSSQLEEQLQAAPPTTAAPSPAPSPSPPPSQQPQPQPQPQTSGYDAATCWARTTFSYIMPLLRLGNARTLQAADLDPLPRRDNVAVRSAALAEAWAAEAKLAQAAAATAAAAGGGAATKQKQRWHLWRALYATNRSEFWTAGLFCLLESFFCILQPVLLGYLVRWLQDAQAANEGTGTGTAGGAAASASSSASVSASHAEGALLAAALGASSFCQVSPAASCPCPRPRSRPPCRTPAALPFSRALASSAPAPPKAVVHHQLYMFTMRGGFNMRMAVTGLVHAKLLRLSAVALQQATSGKVINIVSNDVQRFDLFTPAIHFLWSAPLDLVAIITLVSMQVGAAACFAGVAIVFVSVPLQGHFGRLFGRRRRITARLTDQRVATCAEVFGGMLSVKALGWERPFAERVAAERAAETRSILRSQSIKAVNLTLQVITPALATFSTFATFWARGGALTLPIVFSTMSLLHALRLSIGKHDSRPLATPR